MKSETLAIDNLTWRRCPQCKRWIGAGNQCRFCGKWYRTPSGLRYHERICHFNPQSWSEDGDYTDDEWEYANGRWMKSEMMDFRPTVCHKEYAPDRPPNRDDCFGCPSCRVAYERRIEIVHNVGDEYRPAQDIPIDSGKIVVTCEKVPSGST